MHDGAQPARPHPFLTVPATWRSAMLVMESPPTAGEAQVLAGAREVFATGRTRSGAVAPPATARHRTAGLRAGGRHRRRAGGADLGRTPAETSLGDIVSTRAEAVYALRQPPEMGLALARLAATGAATRPRLGAIRTARRRADHRAWNYPFYLCLGTTGGGRGRGNCVVVKPSKFAPESSALLARLLPKYLDPEAIRVVEGDASVTRELLARASTTRCSPAAPRPAAR